MPRTKKKKAAILRVYMTEELRDAAKTKARSQGRSLSWLIRQYLKQYLDQGLVYEPKPFRERLEEIETD